MSCGKSASDYYYSEAARARVCKTCHLIPEAHEQHKTKSPQVDARTERPEIRYSLWSTVFINGRARSVLLADNLDARNIDIEALKNEHGVHGNLTLRRDDSTYETIL